MNDKQVDDIHFRRRLHYERRAPRNWSVSFSSNAPTPVSGWPGKRADKSFKCSADRTGVPGVNNESSFRNGACTKRCEPRVKTLPRAEISAPRFTSRIGNLLTADRR